MPDKSRKRVVLVHRAADTPPWQLYPAEGPIAEETYLAGFPAAVTARAYCVTQDYELVERGR